MKRLRLSLASLLLLLFSFGAAYADNALSPEMKEVLAKAEAGELDAQLRLAKAYRTGKGAPRDGDAAFKWYRAAAEQGDVEAQGLVAGTLLSERKFEEAAPWFAKAAAQGHPFSTHTLGYLYENGMGVDKDREKAFDLYKKSAALGSPEGMFKLGVMYGEGDIAEKDAHLSCVWYFRANKHAGMENHVLLAILGRELSRMNRTLEKDKLEKCKEQAENWAPEKVAAKGDKSKNNKSKGDKSKGDK